jgi:sterol desaturase/sphingolipid hydroxylase (fatty acid hydroxylase superfamily)
MNLANTVYINAIPAFVVLSIAEIVYLQMERNEKKDKTNVITSMLLGGGGVIVNLFLKGIILFVYSFLYEHRLFSFTNYSWWVWLLCFFADDHSYYWFHRCSHQIRFLWASHIVHHSPEEFTLAGGLRVPWTGSISGSFIFWAWMPLVGFSPAMILGMQAFSVIYQFWMHTELIKKLPTWFDTVFNTPYYHSVHHASDIPYLDKNHGGTLIIWDKIYGTFQQPIFQPIYGVSTQIDSKNPFVIAFSGWKDLLADIKKAKTGSEFVHYLFDSPGWSPDGSSKTTRQIQKELFVSNKTAFKH